MYFFCLHYLTFVSELKIQQDSRLNKSQYTKSIQPNHFNTDTKGTDPSDLIIDRWPNYTRKDYVNSAFARTKGNFFSLM